MIKKQPRFSKQQFDAALRPSASLWIYCVARPISRPVGLWLVNYTNVRPIHLTVFGMLMAALASYFFLQGTRMSLIIGAIVAQTGYVADYLDGLIARLRGTGSPAGAILDPFADLGRILLLTLGLTLGQWFTSGQPMVLVSGTLLLFVYLVDAWIPKIVGDVTRYYDKPDDWQWNGLDRVLVKWKETLERYGLRLVLYGFNEREAVVFFLGPLAGMVTESLILGTLLSLPFLGLRFCLDLAMMKREKVFRGDVPR